MTKINKHWTQKAHDDIDAIFRDIFPLYGMEPREAQIKLSHDMLDALAGRRIALCDAGVGIGKTYAYLVAAVLLNKHQPEDELVKRHYNAGYQVKSFVIATSTIALQKAITNEYIPLLSKMLFEHGIIDEPITCVVRKGKEHYVCDRLVSRRILETTAMNGSDARKDAIKSLMGILDLDEVEHINTYDRARVHVPRRCEQNCRQSDTCRYLRFLQEAIHPGIMFQVCNHNYLFADLQIRGSKGKGLLADYRGVIIDEAHKFPDAARDMYGLSVGRIGIQDLKVDIEEAGFATDAKSLYTAVMLLLGAFEGYTGDSTDKIYRPNHIYKEAIYDCLLEVQDVYRHLKDRIDKGTLSRVLKLGTALRYFYKPSDSVICYVAKDDRDELELRVLKRTLPQWLSKYAWKIPIPYILTSGTLAVGRDYSRFVDRTGIRISRRQPKELYAGSPFDYASNGLYYFPTNIPGCEREAFIPAAVDAAEALIHTTCGHTLMLFTSYQELAAVYTLLKERNLPVPLFAMLNKDMDYIAAFKQSHNGVLMATGVCWEGMDFPGDIVSSLIIVRLPFPIRDVFSEAEKKNHMTLHAFIDAVAAPEMLVKLRQGFGRAFRLTTDSCVVTIMDRRAAPGNRWHKDVMNALPYCPVTRSIRVVERFIHSHKSADYFTLGRDNSCHALSLDEKPFVQVCANPYMEALGYE